MNIFNPLHTKGILKCHNLYPSGQFRKENFSSYVMSIWQMMPSFSLVYRSMATVVCSVQYTCLPGLFNMLETEYTRTHTVHYLRLK